MARESRMKTWPHSVHSLRAVSSLLMVGVSRSVRAVARNRQKFLKITYTCTVDREIFAIKNFSSMTFSDKSEMFCVMYVDLHVYLFWSLKSGNEI